MDLHPQIKIDSLAKEKANKILNENMEGITLSILLEIARVFPNTITNSKLQEILDHKKARISYQLKKLEKLKIIKFITNLEDTRFKPVVLTEDGLFFLSCLQQEFNDYVRT